MSRRRDPLRLSAHWHVDCRIETDLPEDSLIGAHFLTNLVFGAVALGVMLFFGWAVYRTLTLRNQIHYWEKRIADSRQEVREIQRMQREYVAEASKIDRAYAAIRPALLVTDFLSMLGRTLPPQLTIDVIEWNDNGIVVRGNIHESSSIAAGIVSAYADQLNRDAKTTQIFREIKVTNFFRATKNAELQNFEFTFFLQPLPPL